VADGVCGSNLCALTALAMACSAMLVQLPNGNDGLPADVGVLHYHSIRSSKLALDAVVSGLSMYIQSPLKGCMWASCWHHGA
jgi:hypothetical protein